MHSPQQSCFIGYMTHEDMVRQEMTVCGSYNPGQIPCKPRSEQLCCNLARTNSNPLQSQEAWSWLNMVVIVPQKQKERQQSGAHRRSLPIAPNSRALSQRRTGSPCTRVSSQRTNKIHYTTVDIPKSSQIATFFNEEVIYGNNAT